MLPKKAVMFNEIFSYAIRLTELTLAYYVVYSQINRSYTGLYKKKSDIFPNIDSNSRNWVFKYPYRFQNSLFRYQLSH